MAIILNICEVLDCNMNVAINLLIRGVRNGKL